LTAQAAIRRPPSFLAFGDVAQLQADLAWTGFLRATGTAHNSLIGIMWVIFVKGLIGFSV